MLNNRLSQLLEYYRDDPQDPFNIYALALEYLKQNKQEAEKLFENLLSNHPSYIPTYYHAAKLYQELDNKEKALEVYENGIKQAQNVNDFKAVRELQSAYQEMIFESE